MASAPAPAQILCRQCSAPLPIEQGTQYVNCQYCGTTNYVEKGKLVFHYAVRTTVREDEALAAVRRWMAGNETIKGLDRDAQIERPVFQHFPMWFVRTTRDGKEKVYLEPAAALSVSELKHLSIPAADLEPYEHTYDETAVIATVPYNAMLGWVKEEHGLEKQEIAEVSLVHLPTYVFKYGYKDRQYTAVVDGATGEVFANIYPSKWEAPYLAIGAAAFAAYFCAALIPLGGYLFRGGTGLGLGVVIYAVVAAILAIPFFSAAATISAKV
jgi:hypothetical protein